MDRKESIDRINSLTKYPSIETYHKMDDRGNLIDETNPPPSDQLIYTTEKIDGTNVRIIFDFFEGRMYFGSRNELVYAQGDILFNPSQGIVEAMLDLLPFDFDDMRSDITSIYHDKYAIDDMPKLVVVYGELYGGEIGSNARNYTTYPNSFAFSAFDVLQISFDRYHKLRKADPKQVSQDRESHTDGFLGSVEAAEIYQTIGVRPVTNFGQRNQLPKSSTDKDFFPREFPEFAWDKFEGLVFRSEDRSWIVKARVEDYTRAFRKQQPKPTY